MVRRILRIFISFTMVMLMGLHVSAATGGGSIRITLRSGTAYAKDGEITLYMVGEETTGGYRLKKEFGGGLISTQDLQMEDLPQWIAEQAGEGITQKVDEQGTVSFSGLEEGLYLVVQNEASEGYYAIKPFLVRLPWMEEDWYLDVSPKLEPLMEEQPKTGEQMAPAFSVIMMILSGTGLIVCLYWKRKNGWEL